MRMDVQAFNQQDDQGMLAEEFEPVGRVRVQWGPKTKLGLLMDEGKIGWISSEIQREEILTLILFFEQVLRFISFTTGYRYFSQKQ